MELEVTDNPEKARFEVRADGEIVGFVDYRLRDGEIALLHTETDSSFRRRGIAGRLVRSSLDSARERHLAVLPYCSFVRRWITDHPEYADLVPEGQRQRFGLLSAPAFWSVIRASVSVWCPRQHFGLLPAPAPMRP